MLDNYILGDMTSTVYAVNGGMEDWSYGAGWDFDGTPDASILNCKPKTYFYEEETNTRESLDHIRAATYLIETANNKTPLEGTLGSRNVKTAYNS